MADISDVVASNPPRVPDELNTIIINEYEDTTPAPMLEPESGEGDGEGQEQVGEEKQGGGVDVDDSGAEAKFAEAKEAGAPESKDAADVVQAAEQKTAAGVETGEEKEAQGAQDAKDEGRFLRDGSGTLKFGGGQVYEGELLGARMHGRGRYVWPDGTTYEGSFAHGAITGEGAYAWADGSTYVGGVQDGLRHGEGVFTCGGECPSRYEGQWENGQRSGQGTLFYDEKGTSWYKGQFLENMRHGQGNIRYASGNTYEGGWERNRKCGEGKMFWKTRHERYRGGWLDDKPHGFGEFMWLELHGSVPTPGSSAPAGAGASAGVTAKARGAAAPSGSAKGRARPSRVPAGAAGATAGAAAAAGASASGGAGSARDGGIRSTQRQRCNVYKGMYQRGRRHGIGKFFFSDGAIYDGEWAADRKHGNGTHTFADGSVYEGAFQFDRMTGPRGARPGQEQKRANPREVRWNTEDILLPLASAHVAALETARAAAGDAPLPLALRQQAAQQIVRGESEAANSVVLRHISRLKDIYKRFAAVSAGDVAGMFTMTTGELIHFCRVCKLPRDRVGPAVVGRLLLAMRKQYKHTVEVVRSRREAREAEARANAAAAQTAQTEDVGESKEEKGAAESKEQAPQESAPPPPSREGGGDIHDPQRTLLFREFVEAVVRIAHARYREEEDGAGALAEQSTLQPAPGTLLAARLERLWSEHVEPYAMQQDSSDRVLDTLHSKDARDAFAADAPTGGALLRAFRAYASMGRGAADAARREQDGDCTITASACWVLLQDCLVVGSDRPHSSAEDVQKALGTVVFGAADAFGEDSALIDVTFTQFTEITTRLASRMYKGKDSTLQKAAKLTEEFIVPNALEDACQLN
eukprot:g3252.t1